MLASFELALKAERKSANTIETYGDGVRAFLRWCKATGTEPELTKLNVQAFIADLIAAGAEGATAHARLKALRRFSGWLVAEGELAEDPLAGMRSPKVDRKIVETLDEDQLTRLIKACSGQRLSDRRDEAIVRLMIETGARASEVVNLQTADVDLGRSQVVIRRGKGGKGRMVYIGPQTAVALDRYLRMRRSHGLEERRCGWARAAASVITAWTVCSSRGQPLRASLSFTPISYATLSLLGGRRHGAVTTG